MALIDVLNDSFEPNGIKTYKEMMKNGDWNQVFHNWIVRPQNKLIVQRRSQDHPHNPGLICVSAAGQMQAGETILNSSRETREELGLTFTFNEVTYLGNVHLRKAHEIAHVFFAKDATPLQYYQLQKEEVDGVYEMGIKEGIALFSEKAQNITLHGYKRTDDSLVPDTLIATLDDFSANSKEPWLWMFGLAEDYLNGDYNGKTPKVDIKNPLEIF